MGGIYPLGGARLEINRQDEKREEDSPFMYEFVQKCFIIFS